MAEDCSKCPNFIILRSQIDMVKWIFNGFLLLNVAAWGFVSVQLLTVSERTAIVSDLKKEVKHVSEMRGQLNEFLRTHPGD